MGIVRSPLRLPVAGGGTDIPAYATRNTGHLISIAIDHYVIVDISDNRSTSGPVQVRSEEGLPENDPTARCHIQTVLRIVHRFLRARYGMSPPSSLDLGIQIPGTLGSGLGTSSSVIVALLAAFFSNSGVPFGPDRLASDAVELERVILDEAGGVQDQFVSAYGGAVELVTRGLSKVSIDTIEMEKSSIRRIADSVVLATLGEMRQSSTHISSLAANGRLSSRVVQAYDEIKGLVPKARVALVEGDVPALGKLFNLHWSIKDSISHTMSTPGLELLMRMAVQCGSCGSKVVGAGNGGYIAALFTNEEEKLLFMQRASAAHANILQIGGLGIGAGVATQ